MSLTTAARLRVLLSSCVTLTNLFSQSQEWTFWNYTFFCPLAPEKRMRYDSRCAFRRILPQHYAKASRAGLRVPLMIRFDGTSSVGVRGNDPKTTNNGNLHHSVKFGKNLRSIGLQMRPQNHLKYMRGQKILCWKLLIISFGSISLKLFPRWETKKVNKICQINPSVITVERRGMTANNFKALQNEGNINDKGVKNS